MRPRHLTIGGNWYHLMTMHESEAGLAAQAVPYRRATPLSSTCEDIRQKDKIAGHYVRRGRGGAAEGRESEEVAGQIRGREHRVGKQGGDAAQDAEQEQAAGRAEGG